jgi:hypothetical protein
VPFAGFPKSRLGRADVYPNPDNDCGAESFWTRRLTNKNVPVIPKSKDIHLLLYRNSSDLSSNSYLDTIAAKQIFCKYRKYDKRAVMAMDPVQTKWTKSVHGLASVQLFNQLSPDSCHPT